MDGRCAEGKSVELRCECGNFRVVGLKSNAYGRYIFRICHDSSHMKQSYPALKLLNRSISISKPMYVRQESTSDNSCRIFCRKCGFELEIIEQRGSFYAQPKQRFIKGSRSSSSCPCEDPHGLPFIPEGMSSIFDAATRQSLLFSPSDADINERGEQSDSESEFDLMFSRTMEPVVGSFLELPRFE